MTLQKVHNLLIGAREVSGLLRAAIRQEIEAIEIDGLAGFYFWAPSERGAAIELAGVEARIEIEPEFFRPTDQLVGDASRLREATGWDPRIPLRTTLATLLDYWRSQVGRDAEAPAAS